MATFDQLIKTAFDKTFDKKKLYDNLVIGKLAKNDFKDTIGMGDLVKVLLSGEVELFASDGNTLVRDAEQVRVASVDIPIDQCYSVFFTMNEAKRKQIMEASTDEQKINLITEYAKDARQKALAKVDEAYGKLYKRAGLTLDNNAVALTSSNIGKFFALMNRKFKRGRGNGHTSWVDNKMLAVIPPEMTAALVGMPDLQYVESRAKEIVNGYVGRLQGWDIVESNNVASTETDSTITYYPLFGHEGGSLAGGVQSGLKLIDNIPDKGFNTEYKGAFVYGVGAPRADLLGTQAVTVDLSLS